jgi:hypothetical protein
MADDLNEGWLKEDHRGLETASAGRRWLCWCRRSASSKRIREGLHPAEDGAKHAYPRSALLACSPDALRASVGSTDASASLLARFGVVGPTRATRQSVRMIRRRLRQRLRRTVR